MTISTNTDNAVSTSKKPSEPRPVTITSAVAHDGRMPIVVTVVPTKDLDAKGGVFVDFRQDSKPATKSGATLVDSEAVPGADLDRGTAAIAALAAREASQESGSAALAEPEATEPHAATMVADVAHAVASELPGKGKEGKLPATEQAMLSHQIAKPCKLSVGEAQTFRAEVAIPRESGVAWSVRGRFATVDGKDLCSAWLRV